MRRLMAAVLVTLGILTALGCAPAEAPTEVPTETPVPAPTPDIPATVAAEVRAALEAVPTATPVPTPEPTVKPTPTRYRKPLPTLTLEPTPTMEPTPTPEPTAAPPEWEYTGYWSRDPDLEKGIGIAVAAILPAGTEYEVKVATLDAVPHADSRDLYLSLACIGDARAIYLAAYNQDVLSDMESYSLGIWSSIGGWTDDVLQYLSPVLTEDGSMIYITNQAEQREILDMLHAADSLSEGHSLGAGIWPPDTSQLPGQTSWLNPSGIGDALEYLGCYATQN